MKTPVIPSAAALLLAAFTLPVAAQRPPGPPHPHPPGPPPTVTNGEATQDPKDKIQPGDLSSLSSLKDKFTAYQKLVLHGEAAFTAKDAELQRRYASLYDFIYALTVGDRLEEPAARQRVDQLLAIGRKARELRGDADALDSDDSSVILSDLKTLEEDIKNSAAKEAIAETVTPELNRVQWTMEELARFGRTGVITEGKQATIKRKLEELEKHEDDYKEDKKLTDREREELLAQSKETWIAVVRAFR